VTVTTGHKLVPPPLAPSEQEAADIAVIDAREAESSHITRRPLAVDEGMRRLEQRRRLAMGEPAYESEAAKRMRDLREADVVDAARRSQAEIRRHVDTYLKEHFETIAADIASVVVDQVHERLVRGVASMQEAQAIAMARIAADMRAQLRAFAREAWGSKPAKPARRASKGARGRAQAKR
jgi:hypothetical protein